MPVFHPRPPVTALCILAVSTGIGSGFWWRQSHGPAATGKVTRTSLSEAPTNFPATNALPSKKTGAAAAAELAALLDATPGTESWLRLMALVEEASPAELPGILLAVRRNHTAALMVAARWGEIAPQQMLLALRTSEQEKGVLADFGVDINEFMDAAVLPWLERDSASAMAAIVRLGNEKDCPRTVRIRFGVRLFDWDPPTAIPIMRGWGDSNFNGRALRNWAQKDFPSAARLLATLGDSRHVHDGLQIIAKMMAKEDPQAAFDLAVTLPPGSRADSFVRAASSEWALRDPTAAATAVAKLSPAQRKAIGPGLVQIMAMKEPTTALEWTLTHFHGKTRLESISKIACIVAEHHPSRASAFLEQFTTRPLRQAATQGIFEGTYTKTTFGEAASWLLQQPDSSIAADVFYTWRNQGHALSAKAAEIILQNLPDGAAGDKIVAATITGLKGGLRSGLDWAARLPAVHQPAAYQRLMRDWGLSEPAAAREFAASLPPGPAHDAAVHELARQAPWRGEADTLRWLRSLPEADRNTARRALKTTDKPGASRFISAEIWAE